MFVGMGIRKLTPRLSRFSRLSLQGETEMSVKLQYQGELDFNNTKGILLKGTLVGDYGVNGVGDLLDLAPTQNGGADGGITDPNSSYFSLLEQPTANIFPIGHNLGGSYTNIKPNAAPSLSNTGLVVYEPGGNEKATNAAYTAAELAGNFYLLVLVPSQQ
jgi:hypothetical protein